MFNLFEIAFAESGDAANAGLLGGSPIIMIVLMIAIFYFMLIRPENKRKKEAEAMRSSLRNGDSITTIGGVIGTIVDIKEDKIVIETSADRVRVEFAKWAVSTNETGNARTAEEAKKAKEAKAKAKAKSGQKD